MEAVVCHQVPYLITFYRINTSYNLLTTTCIEVQSLDILGHGNVVVQDLDVPGFIKRLNRNMKGVFKPKKVVERLTKKVKAQKD